jgi:hypothetical protein
MGRHPLTVRERGQREARFGRARRVEQAMERLRAAERERHAAIEELVRLGVVRSRVLVGDPGEQLAAAYSPPHRGRARGDGDGKSAQLSATVIA